MSWKAYPWIRTWRERPGSIPARLAATTGLRPERPLGCLPAGMPSPYAPGGAGPENAAAGPRAEPA